MQQSGVRCQQVSDAAERHQVSAGVGCSRVASGVQQVGWTTRQVSDAAEWRQVSDAAERRHA